MKIRAVFGTRSLVGANDGLDPQASASRYATALGEAFAKEWPEAQIDIAWLDDRSSMRIETSDASSEERAREIERVALDLAWVIKGCADWAAR